MHRGKVRTRVTGKFRIMPNSGPQLVTGLNVNDRSGPSVPKAKRDRIRAAIRALRWKGADEIAKSLPSLRGQITYVKAYNPGSAARLQLLLDAVLSEAAQHDL